MPARTWIVRSTEDLGRAIADIRHERGMTQENLAQDGGLSRAWLAKIETGRTSPQVLNHALRLLRRLGATVTITFDENDRG